MLTIYHPATLKVGVRPDRERGFHGLLQHILAAPKDAIFQHLMVFPDHDINRPSPKVKHQLGGGYTLEFGIPKPGTIDDFLAVVTAELAKDGWVVG